MTCPRHIILVKLYTLRPQLAPLGSDDPECPLVVILRRRYINTTSQGIVHAGYLSSTALGKIEEKKIQTMESRVQIDSI